MKLRISCKARSGFSLIELSLAIVAGALIMLGLFRVLSQSVRITGVTRAYAQETIEVGVAVEQLRADTAGIYIPYPALVDWYRSLQRTAPKVARHIPEELQAYQSLLDKKPEAGNESKNPLDDCRPRAQEVCRVLARDGRYEWSFLTTHSIKPDAVAPIQVWYRCEPDPRHEGLWRIVRREEPWKGTRDQATPSPERWYVLWDNLISCTLRMKTMQLPDEVRTGEEEKAARKILEEWAKKPTSSYRASWEISSEKAGLELLIPEEIEYIIVSDQGLAGAQQEHRVVVRPVVASYALAYFLRMRFQYPAPEEGQKPVPGGARV